MRELLAHVQFRGTIRERSVEPFVRLLAALQEKRRVKGVLLDISSGGGGSVASYDLYRAVKRLDSVKPVVASIGSLGASGGYLAALGARRVYAYPGSGVGSIGVVLPHLAVRGLLDRVGIDVELLHAGRHKDAYQGLRPLTDEERTKLQAVVTDDYDSFVGLVAQERKKPLEEVRQLATGEYWSGRRAAELGLVDALGDREDAFAELSRITGVAATRRVLVAPPRPFLERFLSPGLSAFGTALSRTVQETVEDSVLDLLRFQR